MLGGSYATSFAYSESANSDGYNRWKFKMVETLPDGDQNIVYSNYAGQTMLRVFQSGTDQWCEFWSYDSNARVSLYAKPSAISGFDENQPDLLEEIDGNYQYLRDSAGEIFAYSYHNCSGFLASETCGKANWALP